MRKTKFRAWDKRKRRWLEAPLDDGRIFVHWRLDSKVLTLQDKKGDVIWCEFTGLKDKNGVEIYEGDILEAQHWNYPVSWDETNAQWRADRGHTYLPTSTWGHHQIIGNIHENPELME